MYIYCLQGKLTFKHYKTLCETNIGILIFKFFNQNDSNSFKI